MSQEPVPIPPRKEAVVVAVYLDAEDIARLDALAASAGLTRTAVALACLRAGLHAFEKRPDVIEAFFPAGFRPRRRAA